MTNSKYAHLDRSALIRILERRDAERRFGLVWERDELEADAALNDDFVVLEHDLEASCGAGLQRNLIIEGDNYDALRVLRATHSGRIKVIAIDPPYNTGARDFIYNDHYVDRDHAFRHSLWLEFMYRRLSVARELLRPDGVIFVNIGEDEHAHLAMLMDQIFSGMRVGTFVWRTRQGANDAGGAFFTQDHEYVLCYAGPEFRFGGEEKSDALYTNSDGDPFGPWKSSDITKAHTYIQRPNTYYPIRNPNTDVWYPCNPDSVWRFASRDRVTPGQKLRTKTMEEWIDDGRVLWPRNDRTVNYRTRDELDAAITDGAAPFVLRHNLPDLDDLVGKDLGYGRPQFKRYLSDRKKDSKPLSSWIVATLADKLEKGSGDTTVTTMTVGTNTEGTATIQSVLGSKAFTFPKPVSLLRALIAQSTAADGGHVVLDFFAGSGTTGQAVLELNEADDGDRHFILCSNSEATREEPDKNVCRNITRERMARIIEGYVPRTKGRKAGGNNRIAGLGSGFGYLRALRLPVDEVRMRISHEQIWTALQLVHSGAVGDAPLTGSLYVLPLPDGDLVYMPNEDESTLQAIKARLTRRASAIIYSWRPGVVAQYVQGEGVTIAKIPDELLTRFGKPTG
ncbi:site-specific DNA-methyltransferase [Sphingomonas sp. OK281]|uniref:site-specific DNA-methyltransferase n=1 Tax=Sphingomonas sp. OK281 TaxID=1881067 RepID=UPI0008E6A8CA|nr:site-specific DNA-methyltransferase [Sphingomonas sp. OK281]SFO44940.1 adenine-specific DNA-methyltransferase [Sphingomonas sp. OK281]